MRPDDPKSTIPGSTYQSTEGTRIASESTEGADHPEHAPRAGGGRFRVLRHHARGGMGQVSVAFDEELRREVAFKEIQPEHADLASTRSRFVREAEITGRLEHPGIVPVYGFGIFPDGRPYYAMRLIQGEDLRTAIQRFHEADRQSDRDPGERSLALCALLRRFIDACNAVAFAHSKGIIHRDLKPANIMLGPYGETLVVDWGLAKQLASESADESTAPAISVPDTASPSSIAGGISKTDDDATRQGEAVGTLSYTSPEQAAGRLEEVGPASDIYSLGCTLYMLLAGEPAYSARGAELRLSVMEGRFEPPRLRNPRVPKPLDAIVCKAMALRSADRYGTAQDLALDLERWIGDEPVTAWHEPFPARAHRWMRKHPGPVIGVSAGILVALVALAASTLIVETKNRQLNFARTTAVTERDRARHARDRTRAALDAMTSSATGDSLAAQPELSADQRKFLTEALYYYREFAGETAEDENGRLRIAAAARRLGMIEYRLGRTSEAVTAVRQACAEYSRLAADFPAEAEYRRELARSRSDLGWLLAAMGKRGEAEIEYGQALELQENLVAEYQSEPDYRRDLAATLSNKGVLLRQLGKRVEAEAAYRKAIDLQARLAEEYSDRPDYRQELAGYRNNLGVLLADNPRRRAAAEAEYRQVMAIRQKLADEFLERPDYLWKLASSLNNLGRFLADVGKLPDAEGEYRQAAGMQEKLAARFPGAPSYRQDLARTYGNFGNLRVIQGKPAEAEAHYRQAVALQEKLAAEFPAAQGYSIDLAGGLCNLGNLIRDGGKPKESLESLNKAIDILAPIIEKQPELDDARIFLRNAHWGRAQTLDQLGRHPHAMTDWDRAVALSADPERGSARAGRAGSRIQAGQVAEAVAEIDELTKASGWSASQWYDFACVYALASAKSATAKEQFGKRAVELLRLAVEHGFANATQFEKDSDLDSLRSRPDFQQLIKEIRAKATTPRSKKP